MHEASLSPYIDRAGIAHLSTRFKRHMVQTVKALPEDEIRLGASQVAHRPRPARDAAPGEHLRYLVGLQADEIAARSGGVRRGDDPEDLHKMRVATRRLRALLRVGRRLVDSNWAEQIRADAAWLGEALGPVRDLDVLIARIEHESSDFEDLERAAALHLTELLREDRAAARGSMLAALDSERFRELLTRLQAAEIAIPVGSTTISSSAIARRQFRKLNKAVAALRPVPTDAELHAVRIKGKRARYAAELSELSTGKPAARFVAYAKKFQDVIGEHQDAVVAEQAIRKLQERFGDAQTGLAAGRLIERERARRRDARINIPGAWRKLERSGKRAWD